MASASRTVSIVSEATKKHKKHKLRALCFLCLFVALFGRRGGCGRGNRILAVEVRNERARNVDIFSRVQQRHLRSIDDHVDAARFGKGFERPADFFLQWCKEFLAATIVRSLRV